MKVIETIVSETEIKEAFNNTNFGDSDHRQLIKEGLLKVACDYSNGHTLKCILQELGLVGNPKFKNPTLTKKGKEYLYYSFQSK